MNDTVRHRSQAVAGCRRCRLPLAGGGLERSGKTPHGLGQAGTGQPTTAVERGDRPKVNDCAWAGRRH